MFEEEEERELTIYTIYTNIHNIHKYAQYPQYTQYTHYTQNTQYIHTQDMKGIPGRTSSFIGCLISYNKSYMLHMWGLFGMIIVQCCKNFSAQFL